MATEQNFGDNFYLKTFLIGFGIVCAVWSFMIFQFWWGNHDWGYLKSGVSLSSGFFEARYSQHLPTILFFDGHILPFFTLFCALGCLAIESMFIAKYLDVPKSFKNYLFFVLFMGLNPYVATLFYFLYLSFVYVFWSLTGIFLLFLTEKQYKWYHLLTGGLLFFLILGSYPPNIALILVLFVTKRLIQYVNGKENIWNTICRSMYFVTMLGFGYMGFRLAYTYILQKGYINLDMYNIAIKGVFDAVKALATELSGSVTQLFHQHSFMEFSYCFLLSILILTAVLVSLSYKKNKFILILFIVAIFLSSRFCFIIGADVSAGIFRIEYWSRLGLTIFALGVLLRQSNNKINNFLFVWGILAVALFINTDFYIQKIRYLEFSANRQYQARQIDKITMQPMFNLEPKYISLSFGYPVFYVKYMKDKNHSGDIAGVAPIFDFDEINQLFWEEKVSPVVIGAGIWGINNVLRADRAGNGKWQDGNYWRNNPNNVESIKYWLYTKAKYNSVYVDDKYILMVMSLPHFYKYRETVVNKLDK